MKIRRILDVMMAALVVGNTAFIYGMIIVAIVN